MAQLHPPERLASSCDSRLPPSHSLSFSLMMLEPSAIKRHRHPTTSGYEWKKILLDESYIPVSKRFVMKKTNALSSW